MDERLLYPISTTELERRWAAARKGMAERKIDALLMQNSNDFVGGYVRWFTDIPASDGYIPRSVIFPASDLMITVDMGGKGVRRKIDGRDEGHRGVGEQLFTPAFASVAYTHEYQAEIVAAELKHRGYRTIGWVGSGAMPHKFVSRIERELAGKATFVDATEFVDHLKAVKSEEEKEFIRKCAEMQDACFARVLREIKPGMSGNDLTALAQHEGRVRGSLQGIFLGSTAPLGQASRFVNHHFQARKLKPGEHFSMLIENNGPGGMYTEIARTIVLGKASNELIDGFESMREAQANTLRMLKPGASPAEIAAKHDGYMRNHGFPAELRLYSHGQGYDLVERPLIRADETMTIEENMNFAVHPTFESPSIFAVICDNYLIGPDGPGECLHKTPKQIFEV